MTIMMVIMVTDLECDLDIEASHLILLRDLRIYPGAQPGGRWLVVE